MAQTKKPYNGQPSAGRQQDERAAEVERASSRHEPERPIETEMLALERESELLRQERDRLQEIVRKLGLPKKRRFQFIHEHLDQFPLLRLCSALEVSASGYYAWRNRAPSNREMANRELLARIEAVFEASGGTYGSPRVHRALKEQGVSCSENRVARLMRLMNLRPVR